MLDMPGKESGLKYELIKIFFDKLLFGGILFALGFFANLQLEKHRSELSFSLELNKVRVQKIGETWAALNTYEQQIQELDINVMAKHFLDPEHDLNKDLVNAYGEIKQTTEELYTGIHNKLIENRFWIGEEMFKEIGEFVEIAREIVPVRMSADRKKRMTRLLDRSGLGGNLVDNPPIHPLFIDDEEAKIELKDLSKKLDLARKDIIDIRNRLLRD